MTVLVALSMLGLLAVTVMADVRWALHDSRRRVSAMRARWAARSCIALVRAGHRADGRLVDLGGGVGCRVVTEDPGAKLRRDSPLVPALAGAVHDSAEREAYLTSYGDGRLSLRSAPRALLGLLPGFDENAVAEVLRRQKTGRPYASLDELLASLGPTSRRAMLSEYRVLMPLIVPQSETVMLRFRGEVHGESASVEVLEQARVTAGGLALEGERP